MVFVIESMKSQRWSSNVQFKPEEFTIQELSEKLNENKGKFMYCECLSERHLPHNTITKLYIDRDVKREDCEFSDEEIQKDFEMCKAKLDASFGECEWAISQRHV